LSAVHPLLHKATPSSLKEYRAVLLFFLLERYLHLDLLKDYIKETCKIMRVDQSKQHSGRHKEGIGKLEVKL
jgi:hypothetical protein